MQRDVVLQVFIRICPYYRCVCPRDAAFLYFAVSSFFIFTNIIPYNLPPRAEIELTPELHLLKDTLST